MAPRSAYLSSSRVRPTLRSEICVHLRHLWLRKTLRLSDLARDFLGEASWLLVRESFFLIPFSGNSSPPSSLLHPLSSTCRQKER